jgi:hypothetical protein
MGNVLRSPFAQAILAGFIGYGLVNLMAWVFIEISNLASSLAHWGRWITYNQYAGWSVAFTVGVVWLVGSIIFNRD